MALGISASIVSAQEMTPEEEIQSKREINEIKWNENAVYADVVEYMADDSEKTVTVAQQKSMQLLQTHVIEIFAKRMHMEKEDVQEIWDVIDDKCQNIEVRKGDIVRVFTYIMKDAIGLSRSKPKEKDLAEYFGPKPAKEEKTTAIAASPDKSILSNISDTVATPQESVILRSDSVGVFLKEVVNVTDSATNVSQNVDIQAKEQVTVPLSVEQKMSTPDNVSNSSIVKKEVPNQEVKPVLATTTIEPQNAPVKPVEIKVPELCQTLLKQKDMTTLLSFLDTEKTYEKLIYGNYRAMRNPEECYIVILEKSTRKIVTVLGKGKNERMNFVTKKIDNYNNYRGGGNYSAVFVQEL